MPSYKFEPFGLGSEWLQPIVLRYDLGSCHNNATYVILGRDDKITGIVTSPDCTNFEFVSRNHVELSLVDDVLSLKATARQDHVVYLNDIPCSKNIIMRINHNDTISFLGIFSFYNYKITHVMVDDDSNDPACRIIRANISAPSSSPMRQSQPPIRQSQPPSVLIEKEPQRSHNEALAKADCSYSSKANDGPSLVELVSDDRKGPPSSSSSSSSTQMSSIRSSLLRQLECSICCDVLACAVCLSPCGDIFCYVCIADWASKTAQCPICQTPFRLNRVVPNRLSESIVREVLALHVDSDRANDLRQWEERVSEGVRQRKLARGMGEQGPGEGAPCVVDSRSSSSATAAASSSAIASKAPIDLISAVLPATTMALPRSSIRSSADPATLSTTTQPRRRRQRCLSTYFDASSLPHSIVDNTVVHIEDDGRAVKRRSAVGMISAGMGSIAGSSSSSTAVPIPPIAPHGHDLAVFDLTEDSQKL